jgi:hypothetical protein
MSTFITALNRYIFEENKNTIVIAGCGRTGTTLMSAVMGAHPKVTSIDFETNAFVELFSKRNNILKKNYQLLRLEYFKAKLVVQTWLPATIFLECIYVKQPVVALNTNIYPSKLFLKFLPHLERLGVIHENYVSLVDHLNSIDIEDWWSGVLADELFIEFGETYCGLNSEVTNR